MLTAAIGWIASKPLRALLSGVVLMAVGFGAAETYEHTAPWGLKAKLTKATSAATVLAYQRQGAAAQRALDAKVIEKWSAALQTCQNQRQAARDAEKTAIEARDAFTQSQAAAAYRLGRASCGARNAPPPPGPSPRPAAGGVPDDEDLASVFGASAFTPSR